MPPTSSAIPGFDADVFLSDDAGVTFNKIGELREVTLNVDGEPIDVTSHDTAPWREFITGLKTWTLSAETLYIAADVGQDAAFNALVNDTEIKVRLFPKTGSGLARFDGDAIIQSWEQSGPNDDAAAVSLEIQGNGPLVEVAQA